MGNFSYGEDEVKKEAEHKRQENQQNKKRKDNLKMEIQMLKSRSAKAIRRIDEEELANFIRWKSSILDNILKSGVTEEDFYGDEDLIDEGIDYNREIIKDNVEKYLYLPYKKYKLQYKRKEG